MAKSIKCEYCGGNNFYDPDKGLLTCEHCGKESACEIKVKGGILTRKYSKSYIPELKHNTSHNYVCSSCGATVNFEEQEEKKRCPSCGDTSLNRKYGDICVPDGIIPFAISRNKAVEIFRKWISTRKFAPNDLKQMAAHGKISGLYVPAWNMNFRITGQYFANVTKLEEEVDDRTITWHYPVKDVIDKTYLNVLLSGNDRVDDYTLDSLSPYEIQKLRPYSSEYLFGFSGLNTDASLHEKYDEIIHEKKNNITDRIRQNLKEKFDTIESLNVNYNVSNETFNYMYVPVWANHYTYNGKKYHCYINGQTGKAVGKSPKSFWKILSLILGIGAGIAGFVAILMSIIK